MLSYTCHLAALMADGTDLSQVEEVRAPSGRTLPSAPWRS
ncbi:hypothetical protein ATK30_5224 [Amycolatopsis echigonensis]|uniref:Uncharacterized protein n=1 Tax=Amycolatopsis echigonensis TaxID=2576905 RepID=A0A2N3WKF9_9PSEU|nr:hypothetical protein ATK30_5224 [Amycolatopsis niigatensis]